MEQVEPFVEFLVRTADARPEQYAEAIRAAAERHGLSVEEVTAEFERMKSFILSYYEGVAPVRSFLNMAHQSVDCVPFEQQPAVRAARAAGYPTDASPPPAAAITGNSLPWLDAQTLPQRANPVSSPQQLEIPAGTVPLMRITLDRLISLGRLDSLFHKSP